MNKHTSKVIELMKIGFNVSVDASKCEEDIDEILEIAKMLNTTIVLRNPPKSMLNKQSLKKLKGHSHKIIIEL